MTEVYEAEIFWQLGQSFVQSIALFIFISFILGRLSDWVPNRKGWRWHVLASVTFSTGAIVSMTIPFEPAPGIMLDQRNIILLFAGAFGGPWAAIISGAATGLARLYMGGAGAYAGLGAALSSAALGLVFIRHLGRLQTTNSAIIGGLLLCCANLPWALVFPNAAVGVRLTLNFALPFLACYLAAPVILSAILMVHVRKLAAEVELARSRQTLSDVLDISTDWFWETDKDLRFTFLSQSFTRVFSRDPGYYIGKRRSDLATPETRADVLAYEEMLREQKPFVGFRYKLYRADGEERYVSISGKPIFDEDGQFVGYRGSGTEVSDEVRAENKLRDALKSAEEANRAKSAFLSQMSHELRTPLNAIIGFADIIRLQIRGPVGNEEYVKDARHISDSGGHLLNLINQLLDLSKVEAGKLDLHPSECAPADIVNWVARVMEPKIKKANITWSVDDRAPGARGFLDESAIRQVLLNLIGNAVKFTASGGNVGVVIERLTDGGLRLVVWDTGTGIAEAEQANLFKPFERASNAHDLAAEGTGLGLVISKELVEAHGGKVILNSVVGRGTEVEIHLPVSRGEPAAGILAA